MKLTSIQLDRAAGAVLASAAGDALGAGYEFGPPLPDGTPVHMNGGGGFGWAPGEWTDDTSMTVPILRALSEGRMLDDAAQDRIVAEWIDWASTAKDVGNQTRAVLGSADSSAASARSAARLLHDRVGRSGGNGSLMRTGPVALGYLDDPDALVGAAREVSGLTHYDADAGDACVLWSLAIRHAILTGVVDVRVGLDRLDPDRRDRWVGLIEAAEAKQPREFAHNGWVVEAFQGAWSAIHRGSGLIDILERAVRGGRDTDTVAAIAGSLAGATHGASAVPARWRRILHGWPGLSGAELARLAVLAARGGASDAAGWPAANRFAPSAVDRLVRHPHDEGVLLGSLAALRRLPREVDAVVSLCRVGRAETALPTVEFWLVDQSASNPNLRFVLDDAADTIAALRAEGRTVFVHCFEGRSRTPAVAAAYSIRHRGIPASQALDEVLAVLPGHQLNEEFRVELLRGGE